jgi:hypothetical protein
MTSVIRARYALLLALAATTAAACHRAQAARLPEPPIVLDVPQPPPRPLSPVVLAEYEPPPPPPEDPPPPVPAAAKPAAAKPTDKPATAATAPPPPDAPAPVLQTTTNPNASEQKVIGLLQAAERDLANVPYNQLSASAKDTYMQIRSDVKLAKDALTIKHYVYALRIAERSAALAAGLLTKR